MGSMTPRGFDITPDGGHAAARVGANAPASGAGGRMPGPLCAPGRGTTTRPGLR